MQQGNAPGVYIVNQRTNVAFDLLLFHLSKVFGIAAAEKIAVSVCVLVFFWGLFAFLTVTAQRPPWLLAPFIAMLSYGYIFHMGFMNYYLSLGLACIGLSFVWSARRNGIIVCCLLAPLVFLAHPVGFLWFVGTALYRLLWLGLVGNWKLILPAGALLLLFACCWYLAHHPEYKVQWRGTPFWHMNGADQLHVFGPRYIWFALALSLFAVADTGMAFVKESNRLKFFEDRRLILELYLIMFCATTFLPENFRTAGAIGLLGTRLTLISAILLHTTTDNSRVVIGNQHI